MGKKIIFENEYFKIHLKDNVISLENLKGGAAILPITKDNKVLLAKIYRSIIDEISLEVPRGFSEKTENLEQTAKREMIEEISCSSNNIIDMGSFYPDTGLMSSEIKLYLGLDTVIDESDLQQEEGVRSLELYDYDRVYKMAINGEIKDAYTLAAILRSSKYIS